MRIHNIDIYRFSVVFILTNNFNEYTKNINLFCKKANLSIDVQLDLLNTYNTASGFTQAFNIDGNSFKYSRVYLVFADMSDNNKNIAILSHEIAHVCLKVCRVIGYDPIEQQEPFCYLIEHLTSTALDQYSRLVKENKS